MADFDAIVIGAGHNGLITAAYLARAGHRTVLVEARDAVGGCASTVDFAGARVNICNCDHLTFRTTPVMDELRLADHGLRYLEVDPSQLNVYWSGSPAWAMFHDVERTLDSLALAYPDQVDGYRCYARTALPAVRLVFAAATRPPSVGGLARTAAARGGRGAVTLLRWARMSAADVLRQFFTRDEMIASAVCAGPVVWGLSPELPGTGLGALTYAIRHVAHVGRPVGGSGQLPVAIAAALEAAGGVIRTSTTVAGIRCEGTTVRGVVLADGTEITAPVVVSACDPRRTFVEWLTNPPAGAGPVVERWRRTAHQDGYESKIDAVVDRLPSYRSLAEGTAERLGFEPLAASAMIAPTVAEMHRGYELMAAGGIAERPVLFANLPTVVDPTMAPGPWRHVFSLETLFTPYGLPGGWGGSSEPRRWLQAYGTLVQPEFLDGLGDWRAMTPDRYESEFHLPAGHATSFAGGPLAALRSSQPELTRYRTPVGGLYITGAATFPGAGIWGASGRNCALTILRDRS
ncbi:MAG: phytoene desaturase family protein [Acidimicrobiia bacterium]